MGKKITLREVNLALIVGIISVLVWAYLLVPLREDLHTPFYTPPKEWSCALPVSADPQKDCSLINNLDGWSLIHLLLYFLLGVLFPQRLGLIVLISFLFEGIEYYYRGRARWILDPAINIIGYLLGESFSPTLREGLVGWFYYSEVMGSLSTTAFLIFLLGLVFLITRKKLL